MPLITVPLRRFCPAAWLAALTVLGSCASHKARAAAEAESATPPPAQPAPTQAAAAPAAAGTPAPPPGEAPVDQHPAAPPPDLQEKPQPPNGLPPEADTPAAPEHVFEADLRGDTGDGKEPIPKDMRQTNRKIRPSHLCDQRPAEGEATVDYTRRRVEEMVCTTSLWFDGLFGDRYYVHQARHVYGSLELSQSYSEFYGAKTRLRFDARIDLPNLNKRMSGFIGRDNDDDFITDRFDNQTLRARFPQVDDRDEWLAGLGYSLPNRKSLQTSFRIGVRGLGSPEAFVQSRLRYNAYSDDSNLLHFRLTPFWTTRRGLGITGGGEYSYVLSDITLLRWRNIGTLAEDRQGLDWRSSLTLYRGVPRIKSGLAYEIFIRGETGDDVPMHEYGLQTTFRHPIWNGKLFGEWVVGYGFPREDLDDERKGSVLAGVAVEMPFGLKQDQ